MLLPKRVIDGERLWRFGQPPPPRALGRESQRRLGASRLRGSTVTGYTKLFNSILGSTIWREDPATRVVWITLLALADRDGIAEASIPGLASFAGVSIGEAEAAVKKFLSPDPYSRSPEHKGRRIEAVDGGWRILNYDKYRFKMSKDDIRERDRIRKQRQRNRGKCPTKSGTKCDNSEMSAKSNKSKKQRAESKKQNSTPAASAAQGYCHTFSVSGSKNYDAIRDAIDVEGGHCSDEPQAIADRMIAARQKFEAIPKPGREFDGGVVWFITSGTWKKSEEWQKVAAKPKPGSAAEVKQPSVSARMQVLAKECGK
jgi:hypothetical protein